MTQRNPTYTVTAGRFTLRLTSIIYTHIPGKDHSALFSSGRIRLKRRLRSGRRGLQSRPRPVRQAGQREAASSGLTVSESESSPSQPMPGHRPKACRTTCVKPLAPATVPWYKNHPAH